MANSSLPNGPSTTPDAQTHGTTEIRQKTIGKMIAQGLPVKYVAKKLHMSESRIYHLLSDKESIVNAEINRILEEIFTVNDRYLVKLFNTTLQNLHTMLSSSDKEKQFRAMDRIIKIYMARSAKNGITVKQYFGLEPPGGEREFTYDDYVLYHRKLLDAFEKKRRERGLPTLENSSNSAPKHSASPASASPTPGSETAAPNESPPRNSPPDLPAEIREFLDDMNETPPSE